MKVISHIPFLTSRCLNLAFDHLYYVSDDLMEGAESLRQFGEVVITWICVQNCAIALKLFYPNYCLLPYLPTALPLIHIYKYAFIHLFFS